MNLKIRNKRIAEMYLTTDYTIRSIADCYELSDGRVKQIITEEIGLEKFKEIKNIRKQRVADKLREDYLK